MSRLRRCRQLKILRSAMRNNQTKRVWSRKTCLSHTALSRHRNVPAFEIIFELLMLFVLIAIKFYFPPPKNHSVGNLVSIVFTINDTTNLPKQYSPACIRPPKKGKYTEHDYRDKARTSNGD